VSNYPPIVVSKRGAENLPSKNHKNHLNKFYNFATPKITRKLLSICVYGEKKNYRLYNVGDVDPTFNLTKTKNY